MRRIIIAVGNVIIQVLAFVSLYVLAMAGWLTGKDVEAKRESNPSFGVGEWMMPDSPALGAAMGVGLWIGLVALVLYPLCLLASIEKNTRNSS